MREYLTAIYISKGLITLIEPSGEVGVYRQRGLSQFNAEQTDMLVAKNMLDFNWRNYKELPRNWSIAFEEEEYMGKARASFKNPFKTKNKTKK